MSPKDPVMLGLCKQNDLTLLYQKHEDLLDGKKCKQTQKSLKTLMILV